MPFCPAEAGGSSTPQDRECRSRGGSMHGLRLLRVRFLSTPAVPTPASFPTARPTLPPTADGCAQPLPRSGVAPLAVRGLLGRQWPRAPVRALELLRHVSRRCRRLWGASRLCP